MPNPPSWFTMDDVNPFRMFFERSVDGMMIIDQSGIVRFANPSAESMFTEKTAHLVGSLFGVPAVDAPAELTLPFNGGTRSIEMRAGIVTLSDTPFTLAILRDITERKKAEESLRIQRSFMEQLFANSPVGIVTVDNQSRIVDANASFLAMFQFELDEIKGKPTAAFMIGEGKKGESRDMMREILSQKTIITQTTRRRKDGSDIHVQIIAFPVVMDGTVMGVYGIYVDLTDRVQAERRLTDALAYNKIIIDKSPVGIITYHSTGTVVSANDAAVKITGGTRGELEEQNFRTLDSWKQSGMLDKADESLRSQKEQEFETHITTSFGKNVWLSCRFVPFEYGGEQHLLAHFIDITDRKKAEDELLKSEKRFRSIYDASPIGIASTDNQGRLIAINRAMEKIIGYSDKEMRGRSFNEFTLDEDKQIGMKELRDLVEGRKQVSSIEKRYVRSDGTIVWVNLTIAVLRNDQGQFIQTVTMVEDITENKRAVEALKSSEERLKILFEYAPDAYYLNNLAGVFVAGNKAAEDLTGYKREELIGNNFLNLHLLSPESVQKASALLSQSVLGRPTGPDELVLTRKDGSIVPFEIRTFPVTIGGETLVLGIARDITERKRTETYNVILSTLGAELNESTTSREAAKVIANAALTLFGWDACTIDLVNPGNDRVTSVYNVDTIDGRQVEIFPADTNTPPSALMRRIKAGEREIILRTEEEGFSSDSIPFGDVAKPSKSLLFVPIRYSSQTIGIMSIQSYSLNAYREEDLSLLQSLADYCGGALERIHNSAKLLESEEQFRNIYDASPIGIARIDVEGRFIAVNRAMQKIVGYSENELREKSFNDITLAEDKQIGIEELRSLIEKRKLVAQFEKRYVRTDGEVVWVSLTQAPIRNKDDAVLYLLTMVEDVTEKKRIEEKQKNLEAQLSQSQKMEAIGTLAGGIAHDFNNILGIMLAHVTLLPHVFDDREKRNQSIDAISKAILRGAGLVKQMLTFARKTEVSFEEVRINEVIDELMPLLNETFPRIITIETAVGTDVPMIHADKTQIHQVLLNLCVNARDAMMPTGGKLSIVVRQMNGNELRRITAKSKSQSYLELCVSDTGTGIDKETQKRIFDPFFTTKELGKGTGLGLSTVFGIVERHKGFILLDSEIGRGATFRIFIPVKQKEAVVIPHAEAVLAEPAGGNETILIVEDEETLREMVKLLLETKGYTVMTADNGRTGIETFRVNAQRINLVITDLGMPELLGDSMIDEMKKITPGIRVIVVSGFFESNKKSELRSAGVSAIIQKPYGMDELLRKIRTVLDT